MLNVKGIQLTLWVGPGEPGLASEDIMEALRTVEVSRNDDGRSGFQITFEAPRGMTGTGYELVEDSRFGPFSRVILTVNFGDTQTVLMDGFITQQQLEPGSTRDLALFTVTGEDVSIMMDLEEKVREFKASSESMIVEEILGEYAEYGVEPKVTAPSGEQTPDPNEYIPVQRDTDLGFIRELASRFAYIFCMEPGPGVGTNVAYWGPPIVETQAQPALAVDVGPDTNVDSIQFVYNALAATTVAGQVQDHLTDEIASIEVQSSSWTTLSANPALTSQSKVRKALLDFEDAWAPNEPQAMAQAVVDWSTREVLTARGTMDSLRYGQVLQTRGLVGILGASEPYDGIYYVKQVTHKLRQHSYSQEFVLVREGLGAKSSRVNP